MMFYEIPRFSKNKFFLTDEKEHAIVRKIESYCNFV